MKDSEGGVPRSVPIVYLADDPLATPLRGMPSTALWNEFDRTGADQPATFDPARGIWRLAGADATHIVRLGRNFTRS